MTNMNTSAAVLTGPETTLDRPSLLPVEQFAKENSPRWPLLTRIAFRFCLAFFVLLQVPNPLDPLVPWVASHVFHLGRVTQGPFTGSGDTTFAYLELFCVLVAATLVTIVWSALDRKRTNYPRLHQWLRLGVRLMLGTALLSYGGMKLIPAQMPAPGLSTLLETYGESSPMRLLWTFIGASKGYQSFCGASEMLGGILLFIPGLTTLGALISVAVLANVFMLNMCYDVPVKLFSLELLLMAIFLAAPDLRRLADIFVLHRPTTLPEGPSLFKRRWLNRSMAVVLLVLGIGWAAFSLVGSYQARTWWATEPAYAGAWSVEEYVVDGAQQSDAIQWRRFIVDHGGRLTVQYVDAPQDKFMFKFDESKKAFKLTKPGDTNWKVELAVQEQANGLIVLDGQFDGHRIQATLHKEPERKLPLTSRGFHWVNEYPPNR
jgi:uncharacterized membrane protein YphA (DoxX/SURF4 family)